MAVQTTQNGQELAAGDPREVKGDAAPQSLSATISPSTLKRRLILADCVALMVGITTAFIMQAIFKPVPGFIVNEHILLSLTLLPGFAFGAAFNRLYQSRANDRVGEEVRHVLNAVAVGAGSLVLVAFSIQYRELSRLWVFLLVGGISASLLIERRIARFLFRRMRAAGALRRDVIIVGTDAHAIGLLHTYERNPQLGYRVVGFVGPDDIGERAGVHLLGPLERLEDLLEEHGATGVVVSLASIESRDVNVLARRLTDSGYHVALSSALRDIDITRLRPQQLDGRTMIYIEPVLRDGWRAVAKRGSDVAIASAILLLTAPILAGSMLAVKLTSRGSIFFTQIRVGRDGHTFRMFKLRTMVVDAEDRKAALAEQNEADGPLFKISNDPRITSVGRWLRKLSIDELPQLLCVLRGTMSMVGPRPALPEESKQWDDEVRERIRVLPGLTGLWQVSGRSDSSFEQYKRLDLYYVDNWSLLHDLKICARTVKVVMAGSGAS